MNLNLGEWESLGGGKGVEALINLCKEPGFFPIVGPGIPATLYNKKS
jgi:hypothetical protein